MANETRPRRESSGAPRIRKSISPSGAASSPDSGAGAPGTPPPYSGPAEAGTSASGGARDRQDREHFREEGPADREPIRFIRERDREPARERPERAERPEREPGISVRERLARDRSEREGGPIHHDG